MELARSTWYFQHFPSFSQHALQLYTSSRSGLGLRREPCHTLSLSCSSGPLLFPQSSELSKLKAIFNPELKKESKSTETLVEQDSGHEATFTTNRHAIPLFVRCRWCRSVNAGALSIWTQLATGRTLASLRPLPSFGCSNVGYLRQPKLTSRRLGDIIGLDVIWLADMLMLGGCNVIIVDVQWCAGISWMRRSPACSTSDTARTGERSRLRSCLCRLQYCQGPGFSW